MDTNPFCEVFQQLTPENKQKALEILTDIFKSQSDKTESKSNPDLDTETTYPPE